MHPAVFSAFSWGRDPACALFLLFVRAQLYPQWNEGTLRPSLAVFLLLRATVVAALFGWRVLTGVQDRSTWTYSRETGKVPYAQINFGGGKRVNQIGMKFAVGIDLYFLRHGVLDCHCRLQRRYIH